MIASLSTRRSLGADCSVTNLLPVDNRLHTDGKNNSKKVCAFSSSSSKNKWFYHLQ